jgi:hypothetical protein
MAPALAVGLNCSLGVALGAEIVARLGELARDSDAAPGDPASSSAAIVDPHSRCASSSVAWRRINAASRSSAQ